ncbi:LuxR C-terminal-related transcriptional regulator [Streptomyces sp. CC208A]|uniref:helix-turn-helix transcriptional regulator n=1 Tax=Streptomyces sp. CC208A TaxID=3044573 RepID=UPI0024A7CDC8|nr:LuxR C-terminal-related transcriptional regulator [Streptomyces sp. CC208A]
MCRTPAAGEAGEHTEICEEGRRLYRAALTSGAVGRDEAPGCLTALGLLTPSGGEPGTLVPVPPSVATTAQTYPMEQAILAQQRKLAGLRRAISQVESIYQETRHVGEPTIQRLVGASVISAALDEATRGADSELLTAHPGGSRPKGILEESLKRVLLAQGRGVVQRTLYQHTVRNHAPTLEYIRAVTAAGVEVRTLDEVFDRLIVCDRSTAFIPDKGGERSNHAIVVRDAGVVQFFVSVFEHAWERAEPVSFNPDQQRPSLLTEKTRLRVLRLMVDGYTDAAIASRLGMSTRTVATHLKKTSDLLGSNSRAQLAYFLAQTGLLDGPPTTGPGAASASAGRTPSGCSCEKHDDEDEANGGEQPGS